VARARIERAWAIATFNVYAATEPAGIASECAKHRLHLFEDLVITEVVDDKNRPVPVGTTGAKILVSVLFSRTQPLIRYEMSDAVSLSAEPCDCGLPFRTIAAIEGRIEDTLLLPGVGGATVRVHPNVFHRVLERVPVREWQVIQEPSSIRVLLARPDASVSDREVTASLRQELRSAGVVDLDVVVQRVEQVPRTAAGKAPLVRAHREAVAPASQTAKT
jgi:phenylacetate-coenzyme A ligase PaaK-like adenylate-forming protein